jgi:hypothetical protein
MIAPRIRMPAKVSKLASPPASYFSAACRSPSSPAWIRSSTGDGTRQAPVQVQGDALHERDVGLDRHAGPARGRLGVRLDSLWAQAALPETSCSTKNSMRPRGVVRRGH